MTQGDPKRPGAGRPCFARRRNHGREGLSPITHLRKQTDSLISPALRTWVGAADIKSLCGQEVLSGAQDGGAVSAVLANTIRSACQQGDSRRTKNKKGASRSRILLRFPRARAHRQNKGLSSELYGRPRCL